MLLVPSLFLGILAGGVLPGDEPQTPDRPLLQPAVKLLADGKPFDVQIGHAAPYVYDFDKDGKKDLLVGQFGEGKCRIYLNQGTDAAPEFKDFTWLMAGGVPAKTDPG